MCETTKASQATPCGSNKWGRLSGGIRFIQAGTADAQNIDWSITLDGGAFVGAETTGTIDTIPAGQTDAIASSFILGLGETEITVTAGSAQIEASGTVLLFFVLGL